MITGFINSPNQKSQTGAHFAAFESAWPLNVREIYLEIHTDGFFLIKRIQSFLILSISKQLYAKKKKKTARRLTTTSCSILRLESTLIQNLSVGNRLSRISGDSISYSNSLILKTNTKWEAPYEWLTQYTVMTGNMNEKGLCAVWRCYAKKY